LKDDSETEIKNLKEKNISLQEKNDLITIDNNRLESDIVRLIGRKLSLKERIKGRIII
jgi:FtsZ-binding cell division protein ZapB